MAAFWQHGFLQLRRAQQNFLSLFFCIYGATKNPPEVARRVGLRGMIKVARIKVVISKMEIVATTEKSSETGKSSLQVGYKM